MNCIKCECPELNDDDEYCWNCGYPIGNFCTNDHCVLNNGDPVPCPDNASFCSACGSETTYKVEGLISPIDFKRENQ
ncbi:hypothetical protein [Desulfosporosinus sp. OT]|uniref:hypothetical protein n=1 Tax=Desulfosporosinus sp. OT TaxID=913865 RepID=UPI0011124621|nr:hypothetical protein [Desulfosporosinus sp. OT]